MTSTRAATCAGAVTVTEVADDLSIGATTPPRVTVDTEPRSAPSITTADPPALLPLFGRIAVIVGGGDVSGPPTKRPIEVGVPELLVNDIVADTVFVAVS